MVKKCLSRMSGKLSCTVLRRGKESNLFSLVDYCSNEYQKKLKERGFLCSMSRKGNCWDNAPMESFWGKMKCEWLNHQRFTTRDAARAAVFEYIEIFYNRQRIHQSNGYLTPEDYYSAALAA